MKNAQPALVPQRSIRGAIFFGLLLIVVVAFFMNQGATAILDGLWLLVAGLPIAFFAKNMSALVSFGSGT